MSACERVWVASSVDVLHSAFAWAKISFFTRDLSPCTLQQTWDYTVQVSHLTSSSLGTCFWMHGDAIYNTVKFNTLLLDQTKPIWCAHNYVHRKLCIVCVRVCVCVCVCECTCMIENWENQEHWDKKQAVGNTVSLYNLNRSGESKIALVRRTGSLILKPPPLIPFICIHNNTHKWKVRMGEAW